VAKLAAAGGIGGLIGLERRAHHMPIGVAGMMVPSAAQHMLSGFGKLLHWADHAMEDLASSRALDEA
jgi:uncharacterized membrane protein YhiD involved in acid resistance